MQTAKLIILWLILALACFLPAAALTPTAPENRIWEILSTGYDAVGTPITNGYDYPVKSTSAYDQVPTHSIGAQARSFDVERALFGQNAEFKAAKTGGRLGTDLTRAHVADVAAEMESRGWTITGGGGKLPEEY
jgi:hypothetical protein